MKVVLQRVQQASVTIDGECVSQIGAGLLILLGIEPTDTENDALWLVKKSAQMRIFDDEAGVMNLSLQDVGGEALVVSQFTLLASTKKGNRPSYIRAARHDIAVPLYEYFCEQLSALLPAPVRRGRFGADMKVALINDGPVTICMDTNHKE